LHAIWARRRRPLAIPARSGEISEDRLCLVHLVREVNGLGPLREFADALRRHPPGVEHEFVLAMKGFTSPAQARPYLDEVSDLAPSALFFGDRGFDLGVYFMAAAQLRRGRYCFMKSQSRPLVDGWLAKLDAALDRPGVGQVGATGAWSSRRSLMLYLLGLPSAYRKLLPVPAVGRAHVLATQAKHGSREQTSLARSIVARAKALPNAPQELFGFESFPVPHLRSTAFMITHEALVELRLFATETKLDGLALESGRDSITHQLERIGLSSLVVDRAGAAYARDQWHRSYTFMQGDQEGLLVAENHTDFYAAGDLDRRRFLSASVWGEYADPFPSPERERSRGGSRAYTAP
jgi:hypothetical protein